MEDATTSYERLREFIISTLDRDGQHDWDETARLADVLTPAIWNELRMFPIAGLSPNSPALIEVPAIP
jgi:hypothetical protein